MIICISVNIVAIGRLTLPIGFHVAKIFTEIWNLGGQNLPKMMRPLIVVNIGMREDGRAEEEDGKPFSKALI
jgi:hypothetical protein